MKHENIIGWSVIITKTMFLESEISDNCVLTFQIYPILK